MNLKKEMTIIDNQFKDNICSCIFNNERNCYIIKFNSSNKPYFFSSLRCKYLTNPTLIKLDDYILCVNGKILENIREAYEFNYYGHYYYRVFFLDNNYKNFRSNELKKVSKSSLNIIKYIKDISNIISLNTDDGNKLLCKQIDKIKIDSLDTAIANYLKLSNDLANPNSIETLIFPFGCNSSQYEAVENAIYNKISVIEGPPGTGKTQTILNIIANIIVRNMNCQVVSNNNTAIENIAEKLEKYNLNFFEALLGRKKNKDLFVEQQNTDIPNFSKYENMDINNILNVLKSNNAIVREVYNVKKDIANLNQKKSELKLEYKYLKELIKSQKVELFELKKYNKKKLKLLWNELLCVDKINLLDKFKYIFLYRIGSFKFYKNDLNVIMKTLQNKIYIDDLEELDKQIFEKETFVNENKSKEEEYIDFSMAYFKKYLSCKYKDKRKKYTQEEIWRKPNEFLKDYPVILSTTYSSRNTFNNEFKFDYIIMDESSQIDVVTGTLALSSAKYAVIIGDEKQLPNVIPNDIAVKTNKIFNEYNLDKCYSYSLNSFLSSIKSAIPNIQNKMLIEHYRCHPKIINFCNKKFYNNQLAIMTKDNGEEDVIKVIKTVKGNLSRGKANQRQVDEIKNILTVYNDDVGIIVPYNSQVDLVKENLGNVEVSTIHKFQGREKNTIIISTVDDDISEFVGNDKILNVAISRAKKNLYFIVTGNEIKNSNIKDFIDYVDYNNMEILNSKIYSSFDILYKQYEKERLKFFQKHKRIDKLFISENIIYYLLIDILKDYDNLGFHFHQSLNYLLVDKSLLNEREKEYASHHNTHLDFYIFKKIGDKPVMAIEVDGYDNHKRGTKQYERDQLKNNILDKYNIPWIRLKTNGSGEEEKIRKMLDETMKNSL